MSGWRTAALGLAVLLAVLAMVWPAGRSAEGRAAIVRALASYVASLVLGIVVLLLLPLGHGATVPFFATMALVCWVLLGALWLARRYPGLPNPDWVLVPWSPADWGLIALLVLSLLVTVLD